MQRVCLAFLRFCLSAWVGIAIFFVMVVIELRHSKLFDDEVKFNHPRILFPLYYGFEFALVGTALVCAWAGLGNARIARVRRFSTLALVGAAVGIAIWDYAVVYRTLVGMMATNVLPADFVGLHQQSRWLNAAGLVFSALAAILALWPVTSSEAEAPAQK
ncbi:MAG: hypothetical protein ACM3U2_22930 [Deltaproteobacteria bacterium]